MAAGTDIAVQLPDFSFVPERVDVRLVAKTPAPEEAPGKKRLRGMETVFLDDPNIRSDLLLDPGSRSAIIARTRLSLEIEYRKREIWWQAVGRECYGLYLFSRRVGARKKEISRAKKATLLLTEALAPFKTYDIPPPDIGQIIKLLPELTNWLGTGNQSRSASRPTDIYPMMFVARMASLFSQGFKSEAKSTRTGKFVAFVVASTKQSGMNFTDTWVERHTVRWLELKKKTPQELVQDRYFMR